MGSVDEDEFLLRERLAKTTACEVVVGDGVAWEGDYYALVMQSVLLAQLFGLGPHRTISDFICMVNNEDPLVIQTCLAAYGNIQRRMFEVDDKKMPDLPAKIPGKPVASARPARRVKSDDGESLMNLIAHHGQDVRAAREFSEKVRLGEIKLPSMDFSNITKETLQSEDFDLRGTLKQMDEYRKHTKSFTLNISDFMTGPKKKKK